MSYTRIPVGATPEMLEPFYADGRLLRKEALEHGAYYEGHCRNASFARWDAPRNVFVHVRTKFGTRFLEEIRHPADEQRAYDVFVAQRQVPDDEVPETARAW